MQKFSKKIFSKGNLLLSIVVFAIILIPALYTTIFLGSMWDLYGNIGNLPVAVVNLDEKVTFNDEVLAIGDEIIDKLHNNNSLNFNFVDENAAQQDLNDGTYYMVITIPQNFSKNATTLMDENPQKMQLYYNTNPGKNYIASKMSKTAVTNLKAEIESNVTKIYTESVFKRLSEIGNKLNIASDGARKINAGTLELKNDSDILSNNLKKLSESSLTFTNGVSEFKTKLKDYLNVNNTITNGMSELNMGISELNSKTNELTLAVSKIN